MKVIWAYCTLIRAHNCFMAMAAVAVGQYLAPQPGPFRVNIFAMAAAFFVCAFGNIINDIGDIEADRINHPRRALPKGIISADRARTLAFLFLAVSLLLIIGLNDVSRLIVLLAIILVIWYNIRLKHTAYWGNWAVSLLGGLTFLLGGAAYGWDAALAIPGPLIAAVFALLMHSGREIIKDIEDRTGDAFAGRHTAPIRYGNAGPMIVTGVLFLVLILSSLIVYLIGWFNRVYLYLALIFIYLPLIVQYIWLLLAPRRSHFRIISGAIKVEMIAGMAAMIMGRSY